MRNARTALRQLESYDLELAAFHLMKQFEGSAIRDELAEPLNLFTLLPCPETALLLLTCKPEFWPFFEPVNGPFGRGLPPSLRGPAFAGLDDCLERIARNRRTCDAVYNFLDAGTAGGEITIGFHRMRDQQVLFDRLAAIGKRQGFFKRGRQFLRTTIIKTSSAYRCVADKVCIHAMDMDETRERFWDAFGREHTAQWQLKSEIQFNLGTRVREFVQLLR